MTDDPIVELRDAVDALTLPVTHRLPVGFDAKHRTDIPLLEQLQASISSSVGERSAGGRAARERTPLDVGAFTLHEDIDGRIRSWLTDVGIRPSSKSAPAEILRRWFVMWKAVKKEDAAVHAHTTILERWATSIRDLLSPPDKVELTARCPKCTAMWATVGRGEETESVRALWAVWKENQDESYATCRACNTMWRGVGQMRQLRIDIDAAEPETNLERPVAPSNSGQEVTAI